MTSKPLTDVTTSNPPPNEILGVLCVRSSPFDMMLERLVTDRVQLAAVSSYLKPPETMQVTLWNVCVRPDLRRRGIAERMIKQVMTDFLVNFVDYEHVHFDLYVDAENSAAIHLYEKLGFAIESTRDTDGVRLHRMLKTYYRPRYGKNS